jgi:hypothetical protein
MVCYKHCIRLDPHSRADSRDLSECIEIGTVYLAGAGRHGTSPPCLHRLRKRLPTETTTITTAVTMKHELHKTENADDVKSGEI